MNKLEISKIAIYNLELKDGDIIFVRTGDGKTHTYEFKGGKLKISKKTMYNE